jgi:head-tail adaptor
MAIGNLKPIKLIQYTQTIDGAGDATEATEVVYKMWAEVTDNGGSRSQSLGRTEMSDSKTFKVNFRNYLITGDYKIEYFGQVYAITNVQRIDEKRFNYLLTGFNTFESSTGGGGGGTPSNFTSLSYAGDTGILQFTDGNLGGALLQVLFKEAANPNVTYTNAFNEFVTIGPGEFTELPWPFFTPPDSILVIWYLVDALTFQQIGSQNQLVINCTRLSEREFRIYEYNVQNSVLPSTFFATGVIPYNVANQPLSTVYSIEDYVDVMNADPTNATYFQITDYRLQNHPTYGPNYLVTASPVNPYQQWNPGNTILYLQADPI